MSQRDLANAAGISETYVQALEQGRRLSPSMDIVQRITAALEVPVATLTGEPQREASLSDQLRDMSERCRLLETTRVPLMGEVPGEVREQTTEYIEVPWMGIEEAGVSLIALEVIEALTDEGLDVGDYVVVRPDEEVTESGGVFVLSQAGMNLLRRTWRVGSHLHVRPGVDGASVFLDSDITVLGRVVLGGRWRQF